jgi:DUF4097 and DUF4098 domain-containing protein YvlB
MIRKISLLALTSASLLFFTSSLLSQDLKLLHDKNFDVSQGELLELEASSGDVIIDSWDNNQVDVKVYGNSKAEDKVKFTFERTSEGVYIEADKKGSSWFNWGSGIRLRFEIKVPKSFNIKSKTSGGDIKLAGVSGNLILKTSGGDIKMRDNAGTLVAKTSGGDITLNNHDGNSELATSGGDIKCRGAVGNLDAGTSGGDIDLNVSEGIIDAGTSGGDVRLTYNGTNQGVKLRTSGGDIRVAIPADFSAEVYLRTSGGDVDINFPNQNASKISSSKFEGKFNSGGKMLECKTSGGDIIVSSL